MKSENKFSTLTLAILGLVSQEPRSGYDLRKVFTTTPMGHASSSPGAIYPALARLEKCGWVQGNVKNPDSLRPRQVYSLTKAGREALCAYLAQPITHDDIVWNMEIIPLRFVFMGNLIGREATLEFLHALLAETNAYLAPLKDQLTVMEGHTSPYALLAVGYGIESYEATAKWAKHAIETLAKKE